MLMNNIEFYSPTDFVFGKNTEEQTGQLVKRFGGKRLLVVYGQGHAVKSGLMDRVEKALKEAELYYVLLGGIQPNPTDEEVYKGIDLGRQHNVDMILAVGGGSAIDAAKAMAAGIPDDGDFWDFYEGTRTVESALPVGVVLTIPAAGSEGSGNSVITQVASNKKISLRTPRALRPKFSILNPELTYSLPPYQTSAGAVDMMAHIMERYFTNTEHTELTDRLSESILKTIIEVTPQVLDRPEDYDARATLMWCGTLAHTGLCGTGNVEDWSSHALEHELSAFYGVTHGAGLAVIFPAWLTFMVEHNPKKVIKWAHCVWDVNPSGNDKEDALEGISRFKKFLHWIGMPTTIKELGIDNYDIDMLNEHLHVIKGEKVGNYVPLDHKMSKEIYEIAQHE